MLEAYSLNVAVPAASSVPFNNVTLKKGCTATLNGVSTIELNNCGVYMVSFDASSATSVSLQMFKDGVAQPQAQTTGTSPSILTLVQVPRNNSCCACAEPTTIQVRNIGTATATLTDCDICVTKVC